MKYLYIEYKDRDDDVCRVFIKLEYLRLIFHCDFFSSDTPNLVGFDLNTEQTLKIKVDKIQCCETNCRFTSEILKNKFKIDNEIVYDSH